MDRVLSDIFDFFPNSRLLVSVVRRPAPSALPSTTVVRTDLLRVWRPTYNA